MRGAWIMCSAVERLMSPFRNRDGDRRRSGLRGAFLVIAIVALGSCGDDSCAPREGDCESEGWHDEYVLVASLDSVHVPDSVVVGEPVCLAVYADLGHSSCYSFSHFEVRWEAGELEIHPWARNRWRDNVGCLPNVPTIYGEPVCAEAPTLGKLLLTVHSLQGAFRDSVWVVVSREGAGRDGGNDQLTSGLSRRALWHTPG